MIHDTIDKDNLMIIKISISMEEEAKARRRGSEFD